jgi:small GTP-binding protein
MWEEEKAMPANLPPQYFEAERRFRAAKSPEEKITALQTMLAIMPKHKGTDHLHAELRRRIAKLTEETEKRYATSKTSFYIRKEGAGQVVLVGLPNTGKSQLLATVTDARPEIADYPFTTKTPNIGMMKFENIQIQLVDTPPLTSHDSRLWLNNVARNADLIALMVDLSLNSVEQMETILHELASIGITPSESNSEEVAGKQTKKMMIIGNKNDVEDSTLQSKEISSKYAGKFNTISISAKEGKNIEDLGKAIFKLLDIIRVHTKTPGLKPNLNDPMVMKKGSTLKDAAEAVHKDFRAKFKYALVWGSGKFEGQRASPDHLLQDNDIIELHI